MKITIASTDKVVMVNGASARVWEGETESGTPVTCLIPLISPQTHDEDRLGEFDRELLHHDPPRSVTGQELDLRLVI
jgi:hypothetical protein